MTHGRTEITLEKRRHIKKCNWLYQRIWSGYCIQSSRVSFCGQKKQSQKNPCKLNIINLYFEKKKNTTDDMRPKKKLPKERPILALNCVELLVLNGRVNVRGECFMILILKTVLNPKSFTKMNQRTMKIEWNVFQVCKESKIFIAALFTRSASRPSTHQQMNG